MLDIDLEFKETAEEQYKLDIYIAIYCSLLAD